MADLPDEIPDNTSIEIDYLSSVQLVNICSHRRPMDTYNLESRRPSNPSSDELKGDTHGQPSRTPRLGNEWEFAGWGQVKRTEVPLESGQTDNTRKLSAKIGQCRATAIAGNNLIGSVLYTIGITIFVAGQYAPISLLLVSAVVFVFRAIIGEVGTCVPLNGGTYSTILLTSTKMIAAVAASCSILDYLAAATVSAQTAANYFQSEWGLISILPATIGVLGFFAALTLLGMRESSVVCLAIFIGHLGTMVALIVASAVFWARSGSDVLVGNWLSPSLTGTGSVARDIFNGFCIGMLGTTGFEGAINYIEEMKPGVFPKTMRNMSYLVLLINPTLSFLAIATIPLPSIRANTNNIIAIMGEVAAGGSMRLLISIDSVIVLGGAVLGAFVGVAGLIRHMAADRLLPAFLMSRMRWTGAYHWIILSFLGLCIALVLVTRGDITSVSLVFALAFLSVMLIFAIANILLKYKRGRLRREVKASWGTVLIGLGAVVAAIVGNGLYDPRMIATFAIFFVVLIAGMWILLCQVPLLKIVIYFVDGSMRLGKVADSLIRRIKSIRSQPVAFFTNHDEIHVLNKAVQYVQHNETTMYMHIVHFYTLESEIPPNLVANCHVLDHLYPKIQIDLMLVKGKFCPATLWHIADQIGVTRNQCYITCPGEKTEVIGNYGGVRVIML